MAKFKELEGIKLGVTNRLVIEEALSRGVNFERPRKGVSVK